MINYYSTYLLRANGRSGQQRSSAPCGKPLGQVSNALRSAARSAVRLGLRLAVVVGLLNWLVLPVLAQGGISDAKEALSKKPYPWYDAENDGAKSISFGQRPDARSANRASIPVKKLNPNQNNNNGNPAAGGGTGRGNNFGNAVVGGINAIVWVIVISVGLLIIGVLIWAMMRMETEDLEEDVIPQRSLEESIEQLPFKLEAPKKGGFRQQAEASFAAGDYQSAINYLFSHVLVTLDQKGLIRLRKGKTNRQYLGELRPHRRLADYYQQVMVPFEASFFGGHELGKADFATCWDGLDEFQSEAKRASVSSVTSQTQPSQQVVVNA